MFSPQQINLVVYLGATFRRAFTLSTSINGVVAPMDLTGWTARMQIREKLASSTTLAEMTTENGGISVVMEKDGNDVLVKTLLTISLSAADTNLITVRKGVYDLELVDIVGDVYRLFQGSVEFSPQVTR